MPIDADSVHRLAKGLMDSGAVTTLEEAEARLAGFRLGIEIGSEAAADEAHQAALLTCVALGSRVFMGGVLVCGALHARAGRAARHSGSLRDVVAQLGGTVVDALPADLRRISIGDRAKRISPFHVRTVFSGWSAGVVPVAHDLPPSTNAMALSPMLASALAIAEAYADAAGESLAGKREVGMSLWQPETVDWLGCAAGPVLERLPAKLWLLGLGHLGQAYLWGLGLLPYGDVSLEVVLQDFDRVTKSSVSTSVLSKNVAAGRMKTRVVAEWCESRGFETRMYERRFDALMRRSELEPPVALCGVDNIAARRALDGVGFEMVVEAGLGSGPDDFRALQVHTLPGPRRASDLWTPAVAKVARFGPAYERMVADGTMDRCGAAILAGKAVGAPFVGAATATLVLSELLRSLHGGRVNSVVDADLRALEHRVVVHSDRSFNIPYTSSSPTTAQ